MTERCTQRQIADALRQMGWYVRVLLASRALPAQTAGLPDIITFRRVITLLIECKSSAGVLRDTQIAFAQDIAPHLTHTLRYVVACSLDDVLAAVYEVQSSCRGGRVCYPHLAYLAYCRPSAADIRTSHHSPRTAQPPAHPTVSRS